MDEFVLVRTVHVFNQSIVVSVTNTSGGSNDPVLGTSLVVDHADILRSVIFNGAPNLSFLQHTLSPG